MASTIKVDNVQNTPGTNIINKCSVTTTIGAGAGETVAVCAATVNLGRSGGTVNLTCGATQSGFGRTGTVDWNTTKITADPANAVSGTGYFCDTSGGAFTVTLPTSPSAGDIVALSDYTRTFGSNNLTIGRNSKPIGGISQDAELTVTGQSATFVFVDDTEGWINIQETQTSVTGSVPFIIATGGTPSQCGDYEIRKFTGPGTFCVSAVTGCASLDKVDWLVVAGGGGGGTGCAGGGGGAGGFRESPGTATGCYTVSPLGTPGPGNAPITVTAQGYAIAVGAGGPAQGPFTHPTIPPAVQGVQGSTSTFSTIDSAGGGGGGGQPGQSPLGGAGMAGGSGGGGGHGGPAGGVGNTPPTNPPQGQSGVAATPGTPPAPSDSGGGGGGATATGNNAPMGSFSGGAGATTSISGSPTSYAGGGGGSNRCGGSAPDVAGGLGGGGRGSYGPRPTPAPQTAGVVGTVNTGGGGGAGKAATPAPSCRPYGGGAQGGSGIVIIRYKYQ
jgi:hypothetical protein